MLKITLFMTTFLFLSACQKDEFTQSKTFAGNKVVSAETLNLGKNSYVKYCISCHGEKGDGNGIASKVSINLEQAQLVAYLMIKISIVSSKVV